MTSKGKKLPVVGQSVAKKAPAPPPAGAASSDDTAIFQKAQKLLGQKKYPEAAAVLDTLTTPVSSALRANASLLYAGVELMQGNAEKALEVLQRMPEKGDFKFDRGYRHMIMASAYRQLGEIGQALAHAHSAVERGETSGRLLTLADALKHAERLEEAIETLQRALVIEPDNAVALAVLAGYQVLNGEVDEGKETFARFLDIAPHDGDTARNTAFFHAVMGDRKKTLQCLKTALADDADITKAYIKDEVEFDRFRKDADFVALVGR